MYSYYSSSYRQFYKTPLHIHNSPGLTGYLRRTNSLGTRAHYIPTTLRYVQGPLHTHHSQVCPGPTTYPPLSGTSGGPLLHTHHSQVFPGPITYPPLSGIPRAHYIPTTFRYFQGPNVLNVACLASSLLSSFNFSLTSRGRLPPQSNHDSWKLPA